MSWTDQQQQAISKTDCDLIVTAGAGSGKTSTMVARALSLILSGVDVGRITMLTFTDAAAGEMRERFRIELSKRLKGEGDPAVRERLLAQIDALPYAHISTIHSYCYELVREFFQEIPISPSVRILDEEGAARLQAKAFADTLRIMEQRKEFEEMRAIVALRKDDDLWRLVSDLYERMTVQPERERWLTGTLTNTFGVPLEETPACRYLVAKLTHYARYICETSRAMITADRVAGSKDAKGDKALGNLLGKYEAFEGCTTLKECFDAYQILSADASRITPGDSPRKGSIETLRDLGKTVIRDFFKDLVRDCGQYEQLSAHHDELKSFVGVLIDLVVEFDHCYTAVKKEAGVVDFADLEKYALQLLAEEDLKREIVSRADYVFVDEFQDVNEVQNTIVRLISPPERLFAVGDSKQSIYRFRQADPNIFLSRLDELQAKGQAIAFLDNFRSDKQILTFVNKLFAPLMTRSFGGVDYKEQAAFRLREDASDGGKDVVKIAWVTPPDKEPEVLEALYHIQAHHGEEQEVAGDVEGRLIVRYIQDLIGRPVTIKGETRPLGYGDFAILFRDRKGSATNVIKQLLDAGIPVNSDSFENGLGQREIVQLFHYARLLDNGKQDYPLLASMRSAFGGFSDDELALIRLSASPYSPFWQAAEEYAQQEGELADRVRAFLERTQNYRFAASFTPLCNLLLSLVYETGFADRVLTQEDGAARLAVLRTYVLGLKDKYFAEDLSMFCEYAAGVDPDSLELRRPTSTEGVNVMTIHHSKGLEFPVVIVADCGRGRTSGGNPPPVVADRYLGVGTRYYDRETRTYYNSLVRVAIDAKKLAEEREDLLRLLYVATTRAQNYLLMTGTAAEACLVPELGNSFSSWLAYAMGADYSLCGYLWHPDEKEETVPEEIVLPTPSDTTHWGEVLNYQYPYQKSVVLSPKYSVTALNALSQDEEPPLPSLFDADEEPVVGTDYHLVLEHIDLAACTPDQVQAQLDQMVSEGVLTLNERANVDEQAIAKVLSLPLLKRIATGDYSREQRFVMPAVASTLGLDSGENVLVQGVVDLIASVDGKLILVDYKHSRRSPAALADTYRTQLDLYAKAVQSAYGRPVDERYLVEISRALVIAM